MTAPKAADPLAGLRLDVDALIDDPATAIVVCCGSGGVGKTTTAAALGLRAAERGRKVVVLTIDPARRLAQSMGLTELDNTPRVVKGVGGTGELQAMMLDMKRTFDEVVLAHADPERARQIMENPFYQSLSSGFAGTQEYMAMEKLGQLQATGSWDLIIVDTPPSRSALDFLDAPNRLGSFLDGTLIRVLMAPAKVGGRGAMKFLNVGMNLFTGVLGKVLGANVLQDVSTFVAAMDSMFGGFRERADRTYRLLQAPGTAFLVVAAPERDALREAAYFVDRLETDRMPLAGLVLNRVHRTGAPQLTAERALAAAETLEGPETPDSAELAENAGEPAGQGAAGHSAAAQESAEHGTAVLDATEQGDGPDAGSDQGSTVVTATHHVDANGAGGGGGNGGGGGVGGHLLPLETEVLAAGLLRLHADRMRAITHERRMRDRFVSVYPDVPVVEVPALAGDVHDLDGLREIGERLATG